MSRHPGLPNGPRFALYQTARYLRDPYARYAQLRARYGDKITFPSMSGTLVVFFTPEAARELLAGRQDDFVTGFGVSAIRPIVGKHSLLLLSGERHGRERKLLSPAFHGARMRAYSPAVHEAALRVAETWSVGKKITMREQMEQVSLEVILRAVFGARDHAEVRELGELVRLAISQVNPLPLFAPFLQRRFFGFGPWARFLRHKAELDTRIQSLITRARGADGDGEREDVLARLIDARDEDDRGLSDESIRDQMLTLLVAGHETTATALAWAFYEAGRHPEIVKRVRDEVAGLGPSPKAEQFAQLPYLEAFCRETLRAHPIVSEFFRTVKPGHEFIIQGHTIPAGVHIAASILDIHCDPRLYPEPEIFRPERFLERQFAPHEFAAFGGGHRHCLGAAFALSEMMVVMGTLLPRVELELTNAAVVGDNDRMFHRVRPTGKPVDGLLTKMTLETHLIHRDGDRWCIQTGDEAEPLAEFNYEDLRISISWKARIFRDEDEEQRFLNHGDDIAIESVFERFYSDLSERGVAFEVPSDPERDPTFIETLAQTYIREPSTTDAVA